MINWPSFLTVLLAILVAELIITMFRASVNAANNARQ